MSDHPDNSTWMMFLYGECDSTETTAISAHLDDCERCRNAVNSWRTTMSRLDSWTIDTHNTSARLPRLSHVAVSRMRNLVTVMSGVAVILLAFLAGRTLTSGQEIDVAALKTELITELQGEVAQRVKAELEPAISAQFASLKPNDQTLRPLIETELNRATAAAMANWTREDSADRQRTQQLIAGVLSNQMVLRSDLENLAIEAEAQIIRTRRELLRLAMSAQPVTEPIESPLVTPSEDEAQQF
jgi:hypothetical protein